MIEKNTKLFVIALTISVISHSIFVMQFIQPIHFKKLPEYKPPTVTISKNSKEKESIHLYVPSVDYIPSDLTLESRIETCNKIVSADSINIPDDVEIKSVSSNDYKPGTYQFIPEGSTMGTIVVYSGGHMTVLKYDGIYKDYPPMSLSADSFYASNIDVKLQKK